MPNQYRYKMDLPKGDSGINKCTTVIAGLGIFLGFGSVAFFGMGSLHAFTLIYVLLLIVANIFTYHESSIRIIIAAVTGAVAICFIALGTFDFNSSNLARSKSAFFNLLIGFYSLAVCICQSKAMMSENPNK